MLKADEYSTGEGAPLIAVRDIGEGSIRVDDKTALVPDSVVKRLPEYILNCGDIVFCRKGAVDRSGMIESNQTGYILGSDGIRLRPSKRYHPPFLAHQFQRQSIKAWLRQHAIGTTMASMNPDILKRVLLPLPKFTEQRAIAEALSDADALIESLDRLIAKKRDLKQAAMQALLTGKRRLPGFSGEWEVKQFGQVVVPRNERTDPRRTGTHGFCIELEHIGSDTGLLIGSTTTGIHSSVKSVFYTGDVLFGKLRAYLRKYWLADKPGVCSTEVWVLMPRGNLILNAYLHQIVQTDAFVEAASSSYGTHMPRSDWNVVKNCELKLPPTLNEQSAIAEVLSDIDAEIAALEKRRDKTRAIKQGMMQELLTGRIRLV